MQNNSNTIIPASLYKSEESVKVFAPSNPNLSFGNQVIAGASAGLVEVLIMYPLDVVKTRFQLQSKVAGSTQYNGIVDCFKTIIREEGAGALYRGLLSPVLAEAPKRAIKFSANGQYKKMLSDEHGHMSQSKHVLAGALAGMTEAFVNCPFEVVKVRMQSKDNIGLYTSTLQATVSITKNEGLLALYKGFEPQLLRNAVWNGAYFGLINTTKNALPKPQGKAQEMQVSFVAGFIAGGVATTLNTPWDVVKSRMQNQKPGQVLKYNWSIPSMATIYSEEGFRALFKGYVPRILRLGPGGGVMLLAFDVVSGFLQKLSDKKKAL